MDQPPQPPPDADRASPSGGGNADKAFVFGGTMKAPVAAAVARAQSLEVSVSGVQAVSGEPALPGSEAPSPLEVAAGWRVGSEVSPTGTTPQGGAAGGRPQAWGLAAELGGLSLDDEEPEEEDEANNPYHNPRLYRDPNDPDDGLEGEEGDDVEFDEEGGYESPEGGPEGGSSGGWQPDPVRLQHMRSAMMIQRAACLDLIGEKAFNELYALLKSNQVDEASMTDLSRLVFKIIPYDKSEVIQMMYKLLYLESQLEGTGS